MSDRKEFVRMLVEDYSVDVSKALKLASVLPATSYDGILNALGNYGQQVVDPIIELRSRGAKEDEVITRLVNDYQIDINGAFDISETISVG